LPRKAAADPSTKLNAAHQQIPGSRRQAVIAEVLAALPTQARNPAARRFMSKGRRTPPLETGHADECLGVPGLPGECVPKRKALEWPDLGAFAAPPARDRRQERTSSPPELDVRPRKSAGRLTAVIDGSGKNAESEVEKSFNDRRQNGRHSAAVRPENVKKF